MIMGNKAKRYYYLRINENYIVNLEKIKSLGDMCDFIRLNVFTASFDSKEELISNLKKLNLIPNDIKVDTMDIVMRNGDKKRGYTYTLASDTLLLKKDLPFLHETVIRDFFSMNKFHFKLIGEILKRRELALKELKDKYGTKVNLIVIENLNERINIIIRLQELMGFIEHGNYGYIGEYITKLLNSFINSEILYRKNGKQTINKRGLVELAKTVSDYANFEGVILPKKDFTYVNEAKENRAIIDGDISVYHSRNKSYYEDEDVDPDSYMFLEPDDFKRELPNPSKNLRESIQNQIEDLEEKKGKKGIK